MMNQMMRECCGPDGMLDFDKMKGFMERCGKKEFTADELTMIRQFCGRRGKPDADQLERFMETCGCQGEHADS